MSALAHGISGGAGNQRRLMGGAINEMEIYCSDLYTVEFVLEEIAKAKKTQCVDTLVIEDLILRNDDKLNKAAVNLVYKTTLPPKDEFDLDEDVPVTRTEDGQFLVEGAMTIRDVNRAMEWSLPDEEANTVAGLVIHEAQMIPVTGQVFSFHGFRFEVTAREGNRITELKIRPL